MANDDTLRALIRFLPPVQALRDDLEKSLHLETYEGTGDFALQSLGGLRDSILKLTGDPYVTSLSIPAREGMSDREKVSLARLAAGQLAAYLEGQTGMIGQGGGGNHIQTAPVIHLNNVEGMPAEALGKMTEMAASYTKEKAK